TRLLNTAVPRLPPSNLLTIQANFREPVLLYGQHTLAGARTFNMDGLACAPRRWPMGGAVRTAFRAVCEPGTGAQASVGSCCQPRRDQGCPAAGPGIAGRRTHGTSDPHDGDWQG